jgi:hypothetical protein
MLALAGRRDYGFGIIGWGRCRTVGGFRPVRMAAACAVLLVAPFAALAVTAENAGAAYTGCVLTVSTTTGSALLGVPLLVLGQTYDAATGANCWLPHSFITLTIASAPTELATGTAASDGSFAAPFTIPATFPLGPHTLSATGTNLLGQSQVVSLAVTVVASASQASSSSGGGGLAFTGRNSGILLGIAAALMALGAGLTISARRKRESRATV